MPKQGEAGQGKPAGELMRIDEAVVHDLSHELGNYFHKLYYWTDCIRSGASDLGPESSPAEELEQTMHRLQDFLNLALQYFQPAHLNPVQIKVSELSRAVEALLRGENPQATVDVACGPEAADAPIRIDTKILSAGLRVIARLLGGGAGTTLQARCERASRAAGDTVELILTTSGGSVDAAARRAQRVVEWAVAARMVELHGGELITNDDRPGSAGCVLTLPLAT